MGFVAAALLLVAGQVAATDEAELALRSGCLACHRGVEKWIGPPYKDVAEKYAGQSDAATKLADHILKGTGPAGVGWMNADKATLPFMPANGNVTPKNAARLASWILGVDGEITGLPKFVTESVTVSGAVEHKLELNVDDLRKFTWHELPISSHMNGNAGRVETFKGVSLRTLLEAAVVVSRDHNDMKKMAVIAKASDGYAVVFSWNEIFNTAVGEGVLVVFEKDGKPLGEDEGNIAMISAKDVHTGARHVKWLQSIEVRKLVD